MDFTTFFVFRDFSALTKRLVVIGDLFALFAHFRCAEKDFGEGQQARRDKFYLTSVGMIRICVLFFELHNSRVNALKLNNPPKALITSNGIS